MGYNITESKQEHSRAVVMKFGDGLFPAQQNPAHRYVRAGKYTVILTVKNAGGFDTKIVRDYLNVNRK